LPCPEGTNTKQLESFGNLTNQSEESYDEDIIYQENIEAFEVAPRQNSQNVLHISNGERVYLQNHLEYGKYTAFFFYAPWCPSCRKARPQVQTSANTHDNLVLREINIVDWKSPVKDQYKIPAIPYFKLYDPKGNLITEGTSSSSKAYYYILDPSLIK
jgi:thiol-disulfide isomerase/thioredoxin